MLIRWNLATLLVLTLGLAFGSAAAAPRDEIVKLAESWDALLKKHVRADGGVDYQGFEKDWTVLEAWLNQHATLNLDQTTDDDKKAVYINLYNATMIHNLLRHAKDKKIPVSSPQFTALEINSIKVPGGNIWNGDYKVTLAGQKVHLDNIEHDLIRGGASGALGKIKVVKLDPRIHAAVNCAALSCPRVREKAYTPDNVDGMLQENFIAWLSSDEHFIKASDAKLKANSIVYWYYSDFDDYGKDVLKLGGAGDYLATFIKDDAADKAWKVKHLKENFNDRSKFSLKLSTSFDFFYDWKVNDVRNKGTKSH